MVTETGEGQYVDRHRHWQVGDRDRERASMVTETGRVPVW